ncbi:hypothetical protein JCM8097_001172 [Rhodosporidiobolus ruineniae]
MSAAWQEQIRHALVERDQREQALAPLLAHYHRLAHHSLQLKHRNQALLAAASTHRSQPATGGQPTADNPVRAALLASLESQLAQTRADLSEQYKVQSTNAQRLLALTDSLREAEERGREEREELRRLRTEVEGLRERQRWHKEIVEEKEKQLLILQDDHTSLTLELTHLESTVANLRTDNAALLQRWLEAKAAEAEKMNEANQFLDEARRAREEAKRTGALGEAMGEGEIGGGEGEGGAKGKGKAVAEGEKKE